MTPALGADDGAPPPCAQRSLGVEARGSIALTRTAGFGATPPLARASAKDGSPPDLVVREGDHGGRLWGHEERFPRQG